MKRVLLVDDAAFIRESLKMILKRNGFDVVGEAANGQQGVQKYKELMPDVVTLDITMPVMTGNEALTEIMNYDPKAKVVMVSAMGQETMVREAVMAGAKSFVVKPYQEEHIVSVLNKVIGK